MTVTDRGGKVLDELLDAARRRARRDARMIPIRELRRQVAAQPPAPRFEAALRYSPRLAIVAEAKRSSPSAGRLPGLAGGPEAVGELARRYAAAGATCLSVLSEPTRFGGSDADVAAAAAAGLPVLRKDFTVDGYQVWQARALGAAAVLLIVRALDDGALGRLLDEAGEAGLDALVEVHDERELERALVADATLIGINARDLVTLDVDVDGALRLVERARQSGATIVAESGLATVADLERAATAGAHAALVGTALLAADDPAGRLAQLVDGAPARDDRHMVPAHPPRVLVKTCGLRDRRGVRAALRADVDLAGFVVAAGAPRRIAPVDAGRLAAELGPRTRPVLVFRAPSRREVVDVVRQSGVGGVQLAGFEHPPPWIADLPPFDTLIGVVHQPLSARDAVLGAEAWYARGATHVLLEGADARSGGGTGTPAPLGLARRVARILPIGLAGGLAPATVARAVALVRPALVDASSGLERDGRSDPGRIGAFVRAARTDPTGSGRADRRGRFGRFGGQFVPETLVPALAELDEAWRRARRDRSFSAELAMLQRDFIGRPTPLFEVPSTALVESLPGGSSGEATAHRPRVFLKREDLAHTGAHKINNAVGQALLARRTGKRRVIAETGAGQHGVATAAACALLGLECVVYMGTTDMERQAPNLTRMRLLGADVRPVASGNGTLRDALNEALRDWVANVETTAYVLGSAAGPHPYPSLVAELQSVVGREARAQLMAATGRLPDVVVACVGGGSNAIGIMRSFLDTAARLVGVEAGGRGDALGDNAASLGLGRPGVLHGAFTMLTQTDEGQVVEPHSISAGLDYPGVGPQLAALAATGRLEVTRATDAEALAACAWLSRRCGVIPALESAHAVAVARRMLGDLPPDVLVLVNLSGRGDKDLDVVVRELAAGAGGEGPAVRG